VERCAGGTASHRLLDDGAVFVNEEGSMNRKRWNRFLGVALECAIRLLPVLTEVLIYHLRS
jgi:hypothetical protein